MKSLPIKGSVAEGRGGVSSVIASQQGISLHHRQHIDSIYTSPPQNTLALFTALKALKLAYLIYVLDMSQNYKTRIRLFI